MKKITLTLCALLFCAMIQANNAAKSLFVTLNDGQKIEFALSDLPEVTFGNDMMKIKTAKTTYECELWTVKTFTYATATGIKSIKGDAAFSIKDNTLVIDGTNTQVICYKANGEKVILPCQANGSKTLVNINSLKHGVYLIKLNGKVIKIAKQ